MIRCLVEQSLTTAVISYPIEQGWWTNDSSIELTSPQSADQVASAACAALVGSVEASRLVKTHAIITDVGLVSHHTGPIALWTPQRPDEIDHAPVLLGDASSTAEALARVTLSHFYGIEADDYTREDEVGAEVDANLYSDEVPVSDVPPISIREGLAAFHPPEKGELNDLVRAWYILTSFPFPTHLLVVPRELAEQEPDEVEALVTKLRTILDISNQKRRELRRDLANDLDLDRDRFSAFQQDQTTAVSKSVRKAWLDLLRRVSRSMKLPEVKDPLFVTALPAESSE